MPMTTSTPAAKYRSFFFISDTSHVEMRREHLNPESNKKHCKRQKGRPLSVLLCRPTCGLLLSSTFQKEESTAMIVMKFGGTSVQDASAINQVAEIVKTKLDRRPVVVVSAMARVTDS